jgi:signal transduction histidine kinase
MKEAEVQYQKSLLHAAISTQEKERKRIGMDLHDEVGSTLASLRLLIEHFTNKDLPLLTEEQFKHQSKSSIDHIIQNVRHISHDLSPLLKGSYGFYDAICDYCDGINNLGKLQINLDFIDGSERIPLGENVALALYRVISELINNTIKHAAAQHIFLVVFKDETNYAIDYSDDGVGIKNAKENIGMGLQNVASRLDLISAVHYIKSRNGGGFQIIISIPLVSTK